MTFEPETKELSNYLYDLAHENDIPGGHQLEDGDSEKLRKCAERLDAQTVVINGQAKEIATLRGFAQDVMEDWPESSGIDGGDLQNIAEKHGVLRAETRTEPCGENCMCADHGDFPAMCYRKTALLTGKTELNTQDSESVG